MNCIQILGYETDSDGKPAVFHCLVAGRPKELNKRQLIQAVEIMLREGPPATQPADTLSHGVLESR